MDALSGTYAISSPENETILSLRKSGDRFTYSQLLEIISKDVRYAEFDEWKFIEALDGELTRGSLVPTKVEENGEMEVYFERTHFTNRFYERLKNTLSKDIVSGKVTVKGHGSAGLW
jgi:hypothetical protein